MTRSSEPSFPFSRTSDTKVAALEKGYALYAENAQAMAAERVRLSADNRLMTMSRGRSVPDGALGNGWLAQTNQTGAARTLMAGTEIFRRSNSRANVPGFQEDIGESLRAWKINRSMRVRTGSAKIGSQRPDPASLFRPWKKQWNRDQSAITILRSRSTNDNAVFRLKNYWTKTRSKSANLAKIYQNAGMRNVAVREATHAVENDYTNPSAHLFLANSFNALRDRKRIELRYETPWLTELP